MKEMDRGELVGILAEDVESARKYSDEVLPDQLSELAPEFLAELSREITVTGSRKKLFERIIRSLTESQPEAAQALLADLPEGQMRDELYRDHYDRRLRFDREQAVKDFLAMPEGKLKDEAFAQYGSRVAKKGLEEVFAVSAELPIRQREQVIESATVMLSYLNPVELAEALESGELKVSSETKLKAVESLGSQFFRKNPETAWEWMGDLPPQEQPRAMQGIASSMVRSDTVGLAERLSEMPRDELWASGVRVLTGNLDESDPEGAAAWRQALEEEGFE
jgi:hypothetical protein